MNIRTQIFVIVLVLLAMAWMIHMIRANKLDLRYSLTWFVLGGGILILSCFPNLTAWLANVLGIGQPINLLFFSGFCLLLLIVFTLSIAVSKLSDKVKKLTQTIAILEKNQKIENKMS